MTSGYLVRFHYLIITYLECFDIYQTYTLWFCGTGVELDDGCKKLSGKTEQEINRELFQDTRPITNKIPNLYLEGTAM